MEFMKSVPRPTTRLKRGNVLLTNAQGVDTKPVKARLSAFGNIHRRYIEASTKVEEAEALERGELSRILQLDGVQEKAIAALSAALQLDGETRRNPFERFVEHSPGEIHKLPFAEKVKALHHLVATLHRSLGLSEATIAAADQVEHAALTVEEALPGLELRRSYLDMARQARDSLVPQWDAAYVSLRHLTKSLIEQPGLYASLFAAPRSSPKKPKTTDDSPPAEPTAEATAGDSPATAAAPPTPRAA